MLVRYRYLKEQQIVTDRVRDRDGEWNHLEPASAMRRNFIPALLGKSGR